MFGPVFCGVDGPAGLVEAGQSGKGVVGQGSAEHGSVGRAWQSGPGMSRHGDLRNVQARRCPFRHGSLGVVGAVCMVRTEGVARHGSDRQSRVGRMRSGWAEARTAGLVPDGSRGLDRSGLAGSGSAGRGTASPGLAALVRCARIGVTERGRRGLAVTGWPVEAVQGETRPGSPRSGELGVTGQGRHGSYGVERLV